MDAANPTLRTAVWTTEVPIRFSHCDPAGIVYFASAFDILNGVVEDWFTEGLGLSYPDLITRRRLGLGYGRASADFRKPAMFGDRLTYAVRVARLGTKSLTLAITATRGKEDILDASLVIVATDLDRHVSIAIPEDIRAALAAYQEKTA
jgi:4-hydroxybenzoyl-CoA thioesterase